jgi:hypothetical protein
MMKKITAKTCEERIRKNILSTQGHWKGNGHQSGK